MGGGHDYHPARPGPPDPPYMKLLAPKSGLCPPGFHYNREIWYPHGGFFVDPKGWRGRTAFGAAVVGLVYYMVGSWATEHEVRYRPPKVWIPSLLWSPHIPDPVDFRGRTLDRVTGLPKEGQEADTAAHH